MVNFSGGEIAMSSDDTAVLDTEYDPPIIRTRHGSFEANINVDDDEERKDALEVLRDWLSKNVQRMLEAEAALQECVKKTGKWQPSISVTLESADCGHGLYTALGIEIHPDSVEVQHWEGETGEDVHVFYLGTLDPVDGEDSEQVKLPTSAK
jgi:hypothetical protein